MNPPPANAVAPAIDRAAQLLRKRGISIVVTDHKITVGGVRRATVDVTVWRIDRRPTRPRELVARDVPAAGGFTLLIRSMPELPQIMTQYSMPPGDPKSPLAPEATFDIVDDTGKPALSSRWYATPDAISKPGPHLIVEIEAAPDVPVALLDAAAAAAVLPGR